MKRVAWIVGVAVVALVAVVARRPDRMHVERSLVVRAPAEAIFPFITDFHRWPAWSPYEERDPAMQRTYDGAPSGIGAVYHWNGNRDVGEGTARITGATPGRVVNVALEFERPFRGASAATFTLGPDAAGTRVTWALDGPCNFVAKAMGLMIDMDAMIGGDFEHGLARLQAAVSSAEGAR